MKYKNGKSTWNNVEKKWDYSPRDYSDFYCNIIEWESIRKNHKAIERFIGQLCDKIDIKEYDDSKMSEAIEQVTHKKMNVKTYKTLIKDIDDGLYHLWYVDHIEIELGNYKFPNLIILEDYKDYDIELFEKVLVDILNAIYKTLIDKTTEWYDKYLVYYYNDEYDKLYDCTEHGYSYRKKDGNYIYTYNNLTNWKKCFKKKANRQYNGQKIYYNF